MARFVPSLPKYLTQDELKHLFATIGSPRDRALFGLIYHYGLRVGEALMLTVDDINFTNYRITIRRSKNGLGGEKPLWRHTAKLLRSYLRERRDVGPYLFTGRKGPLQKRQVQKLFTDYAKAAGIQARSVHSLRHSMAVHLLEAGRGIELAGPASGIRLQVPVDRIAHRENPLDPTIALRVGMFTDRGALRDPSAPGWPRRLLPLRPIICWALALGGLLQWARRSGHSGWSHWH
jgi:integrase